MCHGHKTMFMEIGDDDVIDDIIKSKSISTFWTAVTWLILMPENGEQKLKMWGIGLALYLYWFWNLPNHYSYHHYLTSDLHFGNFGKYAISDYLFNFVLFISIFVKRIPSWTHKLFARSAHLLLSMIHRWIELFNLSMHLSWDKMYISFLVWTLTKTSFSVTTRPVYHQRPMASFYRLCVVQACKNVRLYLLPIDGYSTLDAKNGIVV